MLNLSATRQIKSCGEFNLKQEENFILFKLKEKCP